MPPRPSIEPTLGATGPVERPDERLLRGVRSIVCIGRMFERVCLETGVSLPQYRLLLFLRHGPERAGELAAKISIKRPTLTALVNGLEKDGRLRRVADRDDGRGVRIELTPVGLEGLEHTERRLAEVLGHLSDLADAETILDAMDQLSRVVDDEIDRRLCKDESSS